MWWHQISYLEADNTGNSLDDYGSNVVTESRISVKHVWIICWACCISCVLTVWLSCWGRSVEVTPDRAPCCCTPPSCRSAGFSRRLSSARHMICNQMMMMMPPKRRSQSAAESHTTATNPSPFFFSFLFHTQLEKQCSIGKGKRVLILHRDDGWLILSRFVRRWSESQTKTRLLPVSYSAQGSFPPPFLATLSLCSAVFSPTEVPSFVCQPTHLWCRFHLGVVLISSKSAHPRNVKTHSY